MLERLTLDLQDRVQLWALHHGVHHCGSATSLCLRNTSGNGDSTTSLGSPFQCLDHPFSEVIFPAVSLNLPGTAWHRLFPGSPEPPFSRPTPTQLPQLLLIRSMPQTLHQLPCPSLDVFQNLSNNLHAFLLFFRLSLKEKVYYNV